MNSYFSLAVALTRAEAAPTLAKVAQKAVAIKRIAKRAPRHDFDSFVYVTDQDGEELEIEVGICYDATYEPAYISGPAENCYPDSSEMDIYDVITINDLPAGITDAMVMEAAEGARDRLEQEAWDDFSAKRNEGRE